MLIIQPIFYYLSSYWQKKNEGKPIFPFLVFTAAESHFLLAHAATLGIGSGANAHYQAGITHEMRLW